MSMDEVGETGSAGVDPEFGDAAVPRDPDASPRKDDDLSQAKFPPETLAFLQTIDRSEEDLLGFIQLREKPELNEEDTNFVKKFVQNMTKEDASNALLSVNMTEKEKEEIIETLKEKREQKDEEMTEDEKSSVEAQAREAEAKIDEEIGRIRTEEDAEKAAGNKEEGDVLLAQAGMAESRRDILKIKMGEYSRKGGKIAWGALLTAFIILAYTMHYIGKTGTGGQQRR